VRWPSVTGHCYDVEASVDLENFTTMAGDVTGTGAELLRTLPMPQAAGAPRSLYVRVRARVLVP
jgi:hypothetical protein